MAATPQTGEEQAMAEQQQAGQGPDVPAQLDQENRPLPTVRSVLEDVAALRGTQDPESPLGQLIERAAALVEKRGGGGRG